MTKTCNHFSLLCLISITVLLNSGKTAIAQSKTDKTEKMKIGGYIQALGFYGISKTGESSADRFLLRRARLDLRVDLSPSVHTNFAF